MLNKYLYFELDHFPNYSLEEYFLNVSNREGKNYFFIKK
jgi:hypothetical protein